MAHFAQLDENNVVIQTIVIGNDTINELPFPESEPVGIVFCKTLFGEDTVWLQTSINNSFRKRYAAVGYSYNPELDIFLDPKPFPSWSLDSGKGSWVAPIPKPGDSVIYYWNEESLSWKVIDVPDDYELPTYEVE